MSAMTVFFSTSLRSWKPPANEKASYAEMAEDAARRPIPERVQLKDPSEFRLIGKPTRRLDGRAKSNGSQKFGIDLDFPGRAGSHSISSIL